MSLPVHSSATMVDLWHLRRLCKRLLSHSSTTRLPLNDIAVSVVVCILFCCSPSSLPLTAALICLRASFSSRRHLRPVMLPAVVSILVLIIAFLLYLSSVKMFCCYRTYTRPWYCILFEILWYFSYYSVCSLIIIFCIMLTFINAFMLYFLNV